MGNDTDFASRRANARRIDDAAWELIAEKLEKDARPARSNRPGAEAGALRRKSSEQQSQGSDCPVRGPGEDAAIAGMSGAAAAELIPVADAAALRPQGLGSPDPPSDRDDPLPSVV